MPASVIAENESSAFDREFLQGISVVPGCCHGLATEFVALDAWGGPRMPQLHRSFWLGLDQASGGSSLFFHPPGAVPS